MNIAEHFQPLSFTPLRLILLLPLVIIIAPFSARAQPPESHLAAAISSLQVMAGGSSENSYDINHDNRIDMEDVFGDLRLAAGDQILPVAQPSLRFNLPGSWDEDWFASPAVYDLDGDGGMEIIAGRHSVLYVWSAAGALLWSAPVGQNATSTIEHGSSRQYASPVVGDLDGDNRGEIAVAYSNKVVVYDHNGLMQSGWPQAFPGSDSEIRSLAATDLNGDGEKELLAVKTSSGPVTVVWNINGSVLAGWPQVTDCDECSDFGGYNQNIGTANLTGDAAPEVITSYDAITIGFHYADGNPMLSHPMFSGPYVSSVPLYHDIANAIQGYGASGTHRDELTSSPPVFTDLDGDQYDEVIVYSDHELTGDTTNLGNCLWALNGDMTRLAGFETPICSGAPLAKSSGPNIVRTCPAPSLANLRGDRRMEIVVPSYDGFMRAFGPDGSLLWSYQFDAPGGYWHGASGAALGDLNHDGLPEVVFSTYGTEENISHLIILDAEGNQLHRVALPGRGSMSVPTLADIDGDNILEIIVSLKDRINYGVSGVQVYDVVTASKGYLPWPTGRGSLDRKGQASQ